MYMFYVLILVILCYVVFLSCYFSLVDCLLVICCCFFYFFKQKTAYEMRISDWSSDVCSSDLSCRQVAMRKTSKSRAGTGQGKGTDSMIAVSASKLATADLNNLMQALELDVVALTEMLIPSGYRAEMGTIDAPAIHYTISGRGRISIGNGPWMSLEPHLLIIKPPNTPFMIEVDGPNGPTRRISRDCWKQHDGVLRIGIPTEQPEVIQTCGFFNASFGQSVGLFRALREPVVENFEPTAKVDQNGKGQ